GTHGTRNGRGRSGSRRRRKITPADTSTNANSVPMLVRSTTSEMFANAENVATNTPVRMVPTYGVLYFGCTFAITGGSSPSRAIEKKMRGCPSWNTSRTLPMAITAPNAMMNRDALSNPGGPDAYCSAVIIGSAVPSVFHGATPVITIEIAMYSTVHTMRLITMPNGIVMSLIVCTVLYKMRLITMPNGMSLAGFFDSSAAVDTA